MRKWSAGSCGEEGGPPLGVTDLRAAGRWEDLLSQVVTRGLRPIQARFLEEGHFLESRRNLVVIAPTNAGKSLVGDLVLLEAVASGHRAVLVEPLRALAQQRTDEVRRLLELATGGPLRGAPQVRLTTGDYRLEHEDITAPPPSDGEVVVATPERLEAIGRHEAGRAWFDAIGAVVIDEAHLVSEPRRGPTLEFLIARLKTLPTPPRIVLLSATVGEPERLRDWLDPADLLVERRRVPRLDLSVWELEDGEDPDEVLASELGQVLEDDQSQVLVFVYRRADAESLARKLVRAGLSWSSGVVAFHSGLPAAQREQVRQRVATGELRVVVTTTALSLGLNLPATHVVVRDSWFHGHGRLEVDQLLQMMGRAGRGDRAGQAAVLVRSNQGWSATELTTALSAEALTPIRSALDRTGTWRRREPDDGLRAASCVAALLATVRGAGMSDAEVTTFSSAMLAGPAFSAAVPSALRWLSAPDSALAYRDETEEPRWQLTRLGERAVTASVPLPYAAGLARLVRDLLSLEVGGRALLSGWSDLDHLLVMELLREDARSLRRFSAALAEQVDGWMETRPGAPPVLFEWVRGDATHSRADQLLGSLGLEVGTPAKARARAYLALAHAIVLLERGRGASTSDLERRWKVTGLEGAEERWRDTAMWLLVGHARIFDLPVFYHHLLEVCGAGADRVRSTKRALAGMRRSALDLIETIKFCSPLGPLAQGVRRMMRDSGKSSVGPGTLRALEAAGFCSMVGVAHASVDQLVAAGVRRDLAKQIGRYCRRRMR
ncbi:MAG: DEAD/DEAH box helicase [Polyangiaceae bacterium]|nr:DEAD/DEAH box helicase [Polyangiaceae bacterium]